MLRIQQLSNDFKARLLELEHQVMTNRLDTSSEFRIYYSYMYQATHGRTARVVRGDFLSATAFDCVDYVFLMRMVRLGVVIT